MNIISDNPYLIQGIRHLLAGEGICPAGTFCVDTGRSLCFFRPGAAPDSMSAFFYHCFLVTDISACPGEIKKRLWRASFTGFRPVHALNLRENNILSLLAAGVSPSVTAACLSSTVSKVSYARSRVLKKTGFQNLNEIIIAMHRLRMFCAGNEDRYPGRHPGSGAWRNTGGLRA